MTRRACAFGLALVPAVAVLTIGCADDPNAPHVEFIGGGFVFNYRLAEAEYGFVVRALRRIPEGTVLEATFENPAGGAPIVVTQRARWGRLQYVFRTPPVTGVRAGRDYRVALALRDPVSGSVIATYERAFRSDVDQSVLPDCPPVVGPGYQPAPQCQERARIGARGTEDRAQ